MRYPSAANPLILLYGGRIPALKNEKTIVTDGSGTRTLQANKDVKTFYKRVQSAVKSQVAAQGFDPIAFPTPVALYAEIFFSIKEAHGIPTTDGDNAYTTLQESLQDKKKLAKTTGAVLGVIDNDRQILSFHVEVLAVPSPRFEGAKLFLWTMNRPNDLQYRKEERRLFEDWLANASKRYAEPHPIDISAMEDLW